MSGRQMQHFPKELVKTDSPLNVPLVKITFLEGVFIGVFVGVLAPLHGLAFFFGVFINSLSESVSMSEDVAPEEPSVSESS